MAVKDLNIEFEDEDDIKAAQAKKKSEVVQDVDLDFDVLTDPNVPEGDVKKAADQALKAATENKAKAAAPAAAKPAAPVAKPAAQAAAPAPKPAATAPAPAMAEVTPIEQRRAAPVQEPAPQNYSAPQVGAHYQLGDELKKVMNGNQILAIELEARIQIEVAERLAMVKAEQAQENKMLEYNVNKVLKQIMAKAPALKKEVIQIQKTVQDFALVDKSKKKGSGEEAA